MAPDDNDQNDRPTDPPEWPDSERPTRVPCLACGGNNVTEIRASEKNAGFFSSVTCRWCSNGAMTADQVRAWNLRQENNPKGD